MNGQKLGYIGSRLVLTRRGKTVFVGLSSAHGNPAIKGLLTSSLAKTRVVADEVIPIRVGEPILGSTRGVVPSNSNTRDGNFKLKTL